MIWMAAVAAAETKQIEMACQRQEALAKKLDLKLVSTSDEVRYFPEAVSLPCLLFLESVSLPLYLCKRIQHGPVCIHLLVTSLVNAFRNQRVPTSRRPKLPQMEGVALSSQPHCVGVTRATPRRRTVAS